MARRDRRGVHTAEDSFIQFAYSLLGFLSRHRGMLGAAAVVALACVVAGFAYRSHLRSYNESALAALRGARSAGELKGVIDSYPGSSAEPLALFRYGRKLIGEGKFEEARAAFSSFVSRFPDDPLLPDAMALRAMVLEQRKMFREAIQAYESFLAKFPHSYLAPRMLVNMATCYGKMDNAAAAREVCERLIKDYSDSPWKSEAERGLERWGGSGERASS